MSNGFILRRNKDDGAKATSAQNRVVKRKKTMFHELKGGSRFKLFVNAVAGVRRLTIICIFLSQHTRRESVNAALAHLRRCNRRSAKNIAFDLMRYGEMSAAESSVDEK